ncbi:hypothetical protein ACI78V_16265 [Geodermatophilus sp. SYSU D00742]
MGRTDDPEDAVEIVVVRPDEVDTLLDLARQHDVAVERIPGRGFEPVTMLTFSIIGTTMAVATLVYLLDRRKGGQIVDLRPGAARMIYRTTDVAYGLVVMIAVDGSLKIEVREPKGMFGQVSEIVTGLSGQLLGQGVSDVKKAVEGQVGGDVATLVPQVDGPDEPARPST